MNIYLSWNEIISRDLGIRVTQLLYFYLSTFYLSTLLSIYPAIYLSYYLSILLSIYSTIYLPTNKSNLLSISHTDYLSFYLSTLLSIQPAIYLSCYLSIPLFIYPSIYLSNFCFIIDFEFCLVITGFGTEGQILESLRRYIDRPSYVSKALFFLFKMTTNNFELLIDNTVARIDIIQVRQIGIRQIKKVRYIVIMFIVQTNVQQSDVSTVYYFL